MKRYVLVAGCSLTVVAVAILAGVLGGNAKHANAHEAQAAAQPSDSPARAAMSGDYPPAVQAAITLAQAVAARSIPGPDGAPVASPGQSADGSSNQWPPNIDLVTANQTTRGIADRYLDGSVLSASRSSTPVVVIRMEGRFVVNHTSPTNSATYSDGRTLTLVIDANDNTALDSQISPDLKPNGLSDPIAVYTK